MSVRLRLAIWRVRLDLRIGPSVTDKTIADGLANLNWRWQAAGHDSMPSDLALLAHYNRAAVRSLIVRAAQERVPATWWDK